jgi:hypothetical protein
VSDVKKAEIQTIGTIHLDPGGSLGPFNDSFQEIVRLILAAGAGLVAEGY